MSVSYTHLYEGTMTLQYAAQIVHVDEEEVLYLAGEEMQDLGGTLMRCV